MMLRITALMAGLAAAMPALADDGRVRTLFYDAQAVVPVSGRAGIQSTILFAADERIENVALGDSSAWQVTPNRRATLLFLKPVVANARTNMTVVTDRRTYMFDLVARPKGAAPLYALRFTYAEPLVIAPAAAAEPAPVVAQAPSPTRLNFSWAAKGTKALAPDRAFDDGQSIYLAWPHGADIPALLAIGADGSEGPVNYSVQGDYIVVDGVPDRLVLRSGRQSAAIERIAPIIPAAAARTAER